MMHKLTLWLFKLIAPFDRSLSDKPAGHYAYDRQSLHPSWCNLHNRRCMYRCKSICLIGDLPPSSL